MTASTIIGCSSNRYVVLTPTTMRLGNYTVLEVEKFGSNLQDSDALGVAGKMPALIVEKIRKYNLNHSDTKLFSRVILSTDSDVDSTGVVLMKGVLLSYETGNRAKRWLLGLGSGKAYCTLQCNFDLPPWIVPSPRVRIWDIERGRHGKKALLRRTDHRPSPTG